jgi:hypothetical protein
MLLGMTLFYDKQNAFHTSFKKGCRISAALLLITFNKLILLLLLILISRVGFKNLLYNVSTDLAGIF